MSNKAHTAPTVEAVGKMNISGNVIPQTWYSTLKKETGKPYLLAIVILSDIVYWYRPVEIRDEITGSLIGYKKKFASDILQRNSKQLAASFGVSEKDAQRALVFLEQKRIIKRVYRQVETPMGILPKVMYIELLTDGLRAVTYPKMTGAEAELVQRCGQICPDDSSENVQYTENTTETSSENTTLTPPTPSRGKSGYSEEFETFWKAYPNKKAKGSAYKAWEKARKAKILPNLEKLLTALEVQKRGTDWQKEGGRFIPHPATWLNASRWEDEVTPQGRSSYAPDANGKSRYIRESEQNFDNLPMTEDGFLDWSKV